MYTSKLVLGTAISLSLLSLAGCASKPPTIADIMRGDTTEFQAQVDLRNELANNQEKGVKLISAGEKQVKSGEEQVKDAEQDMEKGRDDIEKGNRKITEGQSLIEESKRRFREISPGLDI